MTVKVRTCRTGRAVAMTILASVGALLTSWPATAGPKTAAENRIPRTADRDCTPINGRYGYYGNPWCNTGSYRMEDIEFRERERARRRSQKRAAE